MRPRQKQTEPAPTAPLEKALRDLCVQLWKFHTAHSGPEPVPTHTVSLKHERITGRIEFVAGSGEKLVLKVGK